MPESRRKSTRRSRSAVKVAFAFLSLLGLIIFSAGCGGYGTSSSPPSTVSGNTASVSLKNISFNPSDLTVSPGTTVTWTNDDTLTHTVTSDTGLFDSGNLTPGNSFSYTFGNSGTFAYHCNIHTTMKGTITVQAGVAGSSTSGASGGSSPVPGY